MVSYSPKMSGGGNAAAGLLHSTKLKKDQLALREAWAGKKLPAVAQSFLQAIEKGVAATGYSSNLRRAAASQVPPRLASLLLGLTNSQGVTKFTAQMLLAAPDSSKSNLQALLQREVVGSADKMRLSQTVERAFFGRDVRLLQGVLEALPGDMVLIILESVRNAAIDAMLKAWGESIRQNAELDAKNAKLNAQKAAQMRRLQTHNSELAREEQAFSVKQSTASQASRRLDPASDAFGALLLNQRETVLSKTTASLKADKAETVDLSLLEHSFAHAERTQHVAARLADAVNVATLDALDLPEEDLGPKLGLKRGLPRNSG